MLLTRGGSSWRPRRLGERVPSWELLLTDHLYAFRLSLVPESVATENVEAPVVPNQLAFPFLPGRPI